MDDLALALLGCGFPLGGLIWLIVTMVAASKRRALEASLRNVQDDLSLLQQRHREVAHRLHSLESWASALPAAAPAPEAQETQETTEAQDTAEGSETAAATPSAPNAATPDTGVAPNVESAGGIREDAAESARRADGQPAPVVIPPQPATSMAATSPAEVQADTSTHTSTDAGAAPDASPAPGAAEAAQTAEVASASAGEASDLGRVDAAPRTSPTSAAPGNRELGRGGFGRGTGGGQPPAPTAPEPRGAGLEEWLGVKGIALMGAISLVIAAGFLLQYTIQAGVLGPTARVIIGMIVGLGAILLSEKPIRARHEPLANFLAGAGVSILYFSSWASSALYELVPRPVGFVLMAVVTLACCTLAIVRRSRSIALIGWAGGFVTPMALSTGSDRPIALFTYLLLLDGALLFTARKRSWSVLALLSLLGTTLYQSAWLVGRMGDRGLLGIAIIGIFFALFVIAGRGEREGTEAEPFGWRVTRALGCVLPMLLAFSFFGPGSEGVDLSHAGPLLVMLTVGTGVLGRIDGAHWLQAAAATTAGAVLTGHMMATQGVGVGPLFVGVSLVLIVCHWAIAEFNRWRPLSAPTRADGSDGDQDVAPPSAWLNPTHALLAIAGLLTLSPLIGYAHMPFWITATLLVTVALVGARIAHLGTGNGLDAAPPVLLSLATLGVFSLLHVIQGRLAGGPAESTWLGLGITLALLPHLGALFGNPRARRLSNYGAAVAGVTFAYGWMLVGDALPTPPPLLLGVSLIACALVGMAVARGAGGMFWCALVPAVGVRAFAWTFDMSSTQPPWLALTTVMLIAIALAPGVALLGRRALGSLWTFRGAALALPVMFPAVFRLWRAVAGTGSDAVPALLLGVVGVLLLAVARTRAAPAQRLSAMAWAAGVAIAAITLALPLQVENEWLTIGWAAQAVALMFLFVRIDHAGLKYSSLVLFGVVGIRLLLNPVVIDYHPVSALPFLNWIAYTYLVPAACMLAGYFILAPVELSRRRELERSVFPTKAWQSGALAVLAIIVGFAWINLSVVDAFAPDGPLRIDLDRLPARDLTMSFAWGLYGATLLGIGMWRKNTALRGISLALVLLTVGKVFLYDLGNLGDLYRVASFFGLAVSLIVISLAYRRFVFPPTPATPQPPPSGPDHPPQPVAPTESATATATANDAAGEGESR